MRFSGAGSNTRPKKRRCPVANSKLDFSRFPYSLEEAIENNTIHDITKSEKGLEINRIALQMVGRIEPNTPAEEEAIEVLLRCCHYHTDTYRRIVNANRELNGGMGRFKSFFASLQKTFRQETKVPADERRAA